MAPYDLGIYPMAYRAFGIEGGDRSSNGLPPLKYRNSQGLPAMYHPPQAIFIDSISSPMFSLLKSLARLFAFSTSSVPLKSLSG